MDIFLAYNFMLTEIASKQAYHRPKVQISFNKQSYPTQKVSTRDQVKGKIDQLLRQDIQYLKYNFYKPNSHHKLEVTKQNKLINEYVHNNYEEYNLINPLPHLSPLQPIFSQSQVNESRARRRTKKLQVYSSSKKKQLNLSDYRFYQEKKQKFKTEPNLENIEELKHQPTKRIVTHYNLQRYDKGSEKTIIHLRDYSTKHFLSTNPTQNKIYQSGHRLYPSEFSIKIQQPPAFQQSLIQSHYINEGIYPRFTFNREIESRHIKEQKNPFAKVQLKQKQKVPQHYSEKFRYCVGCEKSLLQINIEYHQSACTEFKYAFSLGYEQLADYLSTKIQKIHKELLNQTNLHPNQISLETQLSHLVEASTESKKLGFRTGQFLKDFKKINDCYKLELQQLQRVSRLNWFLQIYENVRKKLKI